MGKTKKSFQGEDPPRDPHCLRRALLPVLIVCLLTLFVLMALKFTWEKEEKDDSRRFETKTEPRRAYLVWVGFDSPSWANRLPSSPTAGFRDKASYLVFKIDELLRSNESKQFYIRTLVTAVGRSGIRLEVFYRSDPSPGLDNTAVKEAMKDVMSTLSDMGLIEDKWTIYVTDISVQDIKVIRVERQADEVCRHNQHMCDDGACVFIEWWCDKIPQCPDYSDELNCPEPEQYPPTTTPTTTTATTTTEATTTYSPEDGVLQKDGFVDGRDDAYPVSNTQPPPTTPTPQSTRTASSLDFSCRPGTFQCDDKACIPIRWVCDSVTDCADRSDEGEAACQLSPPINSLYVNITDVRLSNDFGGRIEVLTNGQWGSVCDDFWGEHEAAVVCRTLHPGLKSFARHNAWYGESTGPIWLDGLHCTGREDSLVHCPGNPVGKVDCEHREDAGALCSPPIEDIRLADGEGPYQGRVELLVNGTWGSVCGGDGWNRRAGDVVCRMLNISGPAFIVDGDHFGDGISGRIWIETLNCTGDEQSLYDCPVETGVMGPVGDIRGKCASDQPAKISCGIPVCDRGYTLCGDKRTCIEVDQLCDREVDCPDSSDEANCTTSCSAEEFACVSARTCINATGVCDGFIECEDGSDELRCVDQRADGAAVVRRNTTWTTLCYDVNTETEVGEAYCKAMGMSGLYQVTPLRQQEMGLRLAKGSMTSPIKGFQYSAEEMCETFKVDCFNNECGLRGPRPVDAFIRNGVSARVAEWRWQVRLVKSGTFNCGGSILTPTRILTAAHCVRNTRPSSLTVIAGDVDRRRTDAQRSEQTRRVKRIWRHPQFRRRGRHSINDVAVLDLTEPIEINRYAGTVCLPKVGDNMADCFITGWGRDESENRVYTLQEARVTLYTHTRCNDEFPSLNEPILPSMLCVTYRNAYSPAGPGDSGGPLVCRSTSGRWVQLGTAGYAPYGRFRSFGRNLAVYHSVGYFIHWIQEQMTKDCGIVCDGESKCLGDSALCDGKNDCLDKADETRFCGVDCDFERNMTCGITLAGEWSLFRASSGGRFPFKTGLMLLHAVERGEDVSHFSSPILNTTNTRCLSLSAHGPPKDLLSGLGSRLDIVSVGNNDQNQTVTFPFIQGSNWTQLQVNISSEVSRVIFVSTVEMSGYLAVDNIELLVGSCPDLVCSDEEWLCEDKRMCVHVDKVCDVRLDCADGSDENNCSQNESVNCDFEHAHQCGYRQAGDIQDWDRFAGSQDFPDHTNINSPSQVVVVEDTSCRADIMLVVDTSGSVDDSEFALQTEFLEDLVSSFSVSNGDVQIGAISFSDNVRLEFRLNAFNNPRDIIRAMGVILNTDGLTETGKALNFLKDTAFLPENGNRPEVPDVVVLLTDGKSTSPSVTRRALTNIRSENYIIFVVGIGPSINITELNSISSDPSSIFTILTDFLTLDRILDPLVDATCKAAGGAVEVVKDAGSQGFFLRYYRATPVSPQLESPVFEVTEPSCYEFYYRMFVGGNISVSLRVINDGNSRVSDSLVWSRIGGARGKWRLGQINLPAGRFQVLFGVSSVDDTHVDIDDTQVRPGQCPSSVITCDGRDFTCDDGQCIDLIQSCDARTHCEDGSDVTVDRVNNGSTQVTNSSIRLSGSSVPGHGLVEIFHNNEWGRVCGGPWTTSDANVACRSLGYSNGVAQLGRLRSGTGRIWLWRASCIGIESSLESCSHSSWGFVPSNGDDCDSDAMVWCYNLDSCRETAHQPSGSAPTDLFPYQRVRLSDGPSDQEGRVEVLYDNVWGSVCADGWSWREAEAVCRTMGYRGSGNVIKSVTPGTGPIWLDDVTCRTSDDNIFDCSFDLYQHDCTHYDDVAIRCETSNCELDQFLCSDNKTCMESLSWCDGETDCPGGDDERQCEIPCAADQFVCDRNTVCLSQQSRCDSLTDCQDGTDEAGCVRLREDGVAEVSVNNQFYPICYRENQGLEAADSFCKTLGEWGASDGMPGNATSIGVTLTKTNSTSLLRGFDASLVGSCTPLVAVCIKKECGRSNPENVHTVNRAGDFICGGTLLNSRFILYTADCISRFSQPVSVVVGNRSRSVTPGWINFDQYVFLELSRPVHDSRPVCLPESSVGTTNRCYISSDIPDPPYGLRVLKTVKVEIYNSTVCRADFPNVTVSSSEICVTLGTARSPICEANVTRPSSSLLCEDRAGFRTLVGTFARQPFECVRDAGRENVAIFSLVEPFLQLIKDNIGCAFQCDGSRCLYSDTQVCDGVFDCVDKSDEIDACGVTCDFEHGSLCGYKQALADNPWVWTVADKFPDHTLRTNSGHFLSHENTGSPTTLSTAIKSPVFTITSTSCLEFYYYMPSHNTTLSVDLQDTGSGSESNDTVWSLSNRQGRRWRLAQISLSSGSYQVVFRASSVYTSASLSVGVDDTRVRLGGCVQSVISCAIDEFECDTGSCILLQDSCNEERKSCPNNFTNTNCSVIADPTDVRLVNGINEGEGRVEVRHNGVWGTVCDDAFGTIDAGVVCRMFGYKTGRTRSFGQGSDRIWLDQVGCDGSEKHIADCSHAGWGIHDCSHGEDVGVVCSGIPIQVVRDPIFSANESVRLRGGSMPSEGRVEVLLNGQWGTICNDSWDEQNAKVLCKTLGYFEGATVNIDEFGLGTGRIWMDEVACSLTSGNIFDCSSPSYGLHDCNHYQDVAVRCVSCESGFVCDENTRCLSLNATCDEVLDCLDGRDEDGCSEPLEPRKMSVFGSLDILGQLRKDNTALVFLNNEWYPICYDEDSKSEMADSFCRDTGKRTLLSVLSSNGTENGVEVYKRKHAAGLGVHSFSKECHVLMVQCIETGCGIKGLNELSSFVDGGMEATAGEWPWYATIERFGVTVCSACVISPSWIASNEQCILKTASISPFRVVVGRDYSDPTDKTVQVFDVKSRFYSNSGHTELNILLVELNSSISMSPSVRPACLPNDTTVFTQQCYSLGEGIFGAGGKKILRKTQVSVYDSPSCMRNFSTRVDLEMRLNVNCAVRKAGLTRTCQSSKAEPVVCKTDTGRWTLQSVATGHQPFHCGVRPYLPLTYTLEAQTVADWMEQTINCKTCDDDKCIPEDRLCDGLNFCQDGSDETVYCGSARNCTFDYKSPCGYNVSRSTQSTWHVFQSSKGYVLSVKPEFAASRVDRRRIIVSEELDISTESCLALSYVLDSGLMQIAVWNESGMTENRTRISEESVHDEWSVYYLPLFVGVRRIQFTAFSNTSAFLDNMTIVGEPCPMSHCSAGEFQCNDFSCIPLAKKCDGNIDCPAGQDEGSHCLECDPATEFQCHNGFCVRQTAVCDSRRDCADGSDEFNCSCAGFSCDRGRTCISNSLYCDQVVDCEDMADETNCGACSATHRRCNNNLCRPARYWCDGDDDCLDGSDESNCTCTSEEWTCANGRCIVNSWVCDGFADCSDSSDERNCSTCLADERVCNDYSCVPEQAWCNGSAECPDASDENNCFILERNTSRSGLVKVVTAENLNLPLCRDSWEEDASDSVCQSMGQGDAVSTRYYQIAEQDFMVYTNETDGGQGVLQNLERDTCPSQEAVHLTCASKDCGKMSVGKPRYQPFIVGGEVSMAGSWPWVALLYYQRTPRCGATIIDDQWLVTAAHCVKEKRLPFYFDILAGTVNKDRPGVTAQRRAVDRIFVHPNFSSTRATLPGDIALLHLSSPLNRTSYVKPVCLPQVHTDFPLSTTCFSAGFGSVLRGAKVLVPTMREGKLRLWTPDRCSQAYNNRISTDDKLCAGYASGVITPCFGDSGGPLMCQVTKGRWTIAGVISIGESNCDKATSFSDAKPSAFTKITSYIDWIRVTMTDYNPTK